VGESRVRRAGEERIWLEETCCRLSGAAAGSTSAMWGCNSAALDPIVRRRACFGSARRASDASREASALLVSGESVGAAAAAVWCGGEEVGEVEEEEETDERAGYDAGERWTRGRVALLLRDAGGMVLQGEQSASSSSDSETLTLALALALSLSASCTNTPR
jgi:hypothetical protein